MKFLPVLFILLFFAACEKSINIQPESQNSLLVVDGTIENGQRPLILLSTSLNYFSEIDPSVLGASIVKDAKVTLSDGVTTTELKTYQQSVGGIFNLTYYSTDSAGPEAMVGEIGKTYNLKIDYNNQEYTSDT